MQSTGIIGVIKQRGMAAIEDGLRHTPVHIIKRNTSAAVVLSEAQYQSLTCGHQPACLGMTALQWLLMQPSTCTREKAEIDASQIEERDW